MCPHIPWNRSHNVQVPGQDEDGRMAVLNACQFAVVLRWFVKYTFFHLRYIFGVPWLPAFCWTCVLCLVTCLEGTNESSCMYHWDWTKMTLAKTPSLSRGWLLPCYTERWLVQYCWECCLPPSWHGFTSPLGDWELPTFSATSERFLRRCLDAYFSHCQYLILCSGEHSIGTYQHTQDEGGSRQPPDRVHLGCMADSNRCLSRFEFLGCTHQDFPATPEKRLENCHAHFSRKMLTYWLWCRV